MSDSPDSQTYLASLVRARDMDRYLSILLSPRPKRTALMVLAAFNAELAQIPHVTSEPMLSAIRFQWWRETLSGNSDNSGRTGNPVADALADVQRLHDLPLELINEMLDGREGVNMSTIGDVEERLAVVEAPLFELSALMLGGIRSNGLRQAANAAARACSAAKSTEGDRAKLMEIAASGREECARHLRQLSPDIFPAFLPVSLTTFYQQVPKDNPMRPLHRIWTMWRASRRGELL